MNVCGLCAEPAVGHLCHRCMETADLLFSMPSKPAPAAPKFVKVLQSGRLIHHG